MIAEDFAPVVHNGHVRVLATESIAGTTVEGARARRGPCVHGAKKTRESLPREAQAGAASAVRHRHDHRLAVKLVKPKSFLTPTSGLVSIHVVKSTVCAAPRQAETLWFTP